MRCHLRSFTNWNVLDSSQRSQRHFRRKFWFGLSPFSGYQSAQKWHNTYIHIIYIYKRNIQYRYYVHTTYHFEPKTATLLASTKKMVSIYTSVSIQKKTPPAIFASDKGTWFHWVAESIQVPLWWDYLTWSTFGYKFWKVGGGVWFTPPIFSRKTLGFLVKKCQEKWMWKS